MNVAELVAVLNFRVEGADQLKAFDETLKAIAASAREAAAALKEITSAKLPKGIIPQQTPQNQPPAPPSAPVTPVPVMPVPVTPPPAPVVPPPIIPGAPNTKPSGSFWGQFGKLGLAILGISTLAAAMKRLISGINEMVQNSRRNALATDRLTMETGLTRREIKAYERLGALGGIDREEVQSMLAGIAEKANAVRLGIGDPSAFSMAGVNPYANPNEIIRQFHARNRGLTAAQEIQFGKGLGITPEMVYALRQFGDELDKLTKDAELSAREQKNTLELNKAWQEMTFNIGVLADRLTSDLAPILKGIIELISGPLVYAAKNGLSAFIPTLKPGSGVGPVPGMVGDLSQFMRPRNGDRTTTTTVTVDAKVTGVERPQETAQAVRRLMYQPFFEAYYGRPQYQH